MRSRTYVATGIFGQLSTWTIFFSSFRIQHIFTSLFFHHSLPGIFGLDCQQTQVRGIVQFTNDLPKLLLDFSSPSLLMTPTIGTLLLDMLREWIPKASDGVFVRNRSFAFLIGSLSFPRAQLPRACLHLQALHANLTVGVKSGGWNRSVILNAKISTKLLW
jgi:hypothetical protein